MRITGYRSLRTQHQWGRPIGDANGVVGSGITSVPILLLETDIGITGVGLGAHEQIDSLFPALVDADPRAVGTLYDRMLDALFKSGHQGASFGTVGTVDTALWDLKAKLAEQPLWRLLGAFDRTVPGYASGLDITLDLEQLDQLYSTFAERGLRTGKLKGGRDPDADAVRLDVISAALERNARRPGLALDANESWSPKQAVRHVAELESKLDLAWVEEPVRRWDAAGLATVSSGVRAAVASGENLTGLEQYRQLLAQGALDIVQTGTIYGITHFLRVAAAAHLFSLPVSPVAYHGNALAHAAAALPNHLATEVQTLHAPVGLAIDQTVQDGYIVLGDSHGLGVEVDEAALDPLDRPDRMAGPERRPPDAGLRLSIR